MRVVLFALAAMVAVPAFAADKVTPDQIKATFVTGQPFTSTSPSGKVVMITLKADGTGVLAPKGSKGDAGKWRVTDKGYCSTWGKSAERCYTMTKDGNVYTVMNAAGGVAAKWAPPAAPAAAKKP